ncbi:MAG TPA: hypothetical protein VNZ52_08475 [Candidatus Thermoplasmatota archaeon]|nr:hypothetical protein [Candidatus Thermoplasmatota archaeon]
MPKAIIHLLPTPADLTGALGQQMAQAFGGAFPGGRIPVAVPEEPEGKTRITIEGAVRSVTDNQVVRLLTATDKECGLVPIHRLNYIEYLA